MTKSEKNASALDLHTGHPSYVQEKPSALRREHPALQKMKFIKCFLFFGVIFALLDPDPMNLDPIRIRIRIHNTACFRPLNNTAWEASSKGGKYRPV
jgi:hypothetical protein